MTLTIKPGLPLILCCCLVAAFLNGQAQTQAPSANAEIPTTPQSASVALAPARFQLDMMPGTETTVVVNLNHRSAGTDAGTFRVIASLNDWNISSEGQVEFHKAGTQPNSASSWMIFSPAEVAVRPGRTHAIRVTITVPKDATPGDHLAALIVEPRGDNKRTVGAQLQMSVRFRMAAVFYITVPQATRHGVLQNLKAEAAANGVIITPTLKNEGNSMIRPVSSLTISDTTGRVVAELSAGGEEMPILGNSETKPRLLIQRTLPPGAYSVRYRIDFQDGGKVTEGITELLIKKPKD